MAACNNNSCFTCCICGVQKYSVQKYLKHLYIMHEHTPGFSPVCNIDGCPAKYKSVKCLRHHMRKKHSFIFSAPQVLTNESDNFMIETMENQILADSVGDNTTTEFLNESITENCSLETSSLDSHLGAISLSSLDNLLSCLQKHAMFVISLAEKHLIPSVVQIDLTNEVQPLLTYFSHIFCDLIKQQLGENFAYNSGLNQLLNSDLLLDKVLSVVNSNKKVVSFCKSNLGLILPVEIKLHSMNENQCEYGLKTQSCETFQYVPVLPLLKKLVVNELIWNSIKRKLEKDESINNELLYSYSDGLNCKQHVIFKDKNALRIHLCCDEFEVCNPIGAHRSVHKLCAFYFFLGNIEEQYISQLQNINLCILVKEKFIKKYKTYKQVLRPLIQDLLTLQNEAILFTVDNMMVRLFGGVATISADNLSSHALAGFQRVFNSCRFCRQCMTSYVDKNKILVECDTTIRTNEMHYYHLSAISGPGHISSSVYGVEK